MKISRDILWTRLQPDARRDVDMDEWSVHGGKWIVFDRKDKISYVAERLVPYIDSGEVEGAKYWNRDPSALCVYSLDKNREKTGEILKTLGADRGRVWEYDYATVKNLKDPASFMYSWFSKFRTILQSYGLRGTLQLIREILKPGN